MCAQQKQTSVRKKDGRLVVDESRRGAGYWISSSSTSKTSIPCGAPARPL
jgi:hypothetical protein